MHVLVLPSDATGCGTYRMIWPGEACRAAGKMVTVKPSSPKILKDPLGNIQGIAIGNADVVVFQRPGKEDIQQVIDIIQSNGRKVVIDMDDSLSKIHPRNPAHKEYDPRVNHQRNYLHAAQACRMADWVTVTTPALAEEYGSHGRVSVVPNHVPRRYLDIPRPQNDVPIVGWAGWTNTHPDDLTVTAGMINQALTDSGGVFMAYGDLNIFRDLQVRNRAPHIYHGFTNINEYPKTLARLDIGLVPLRKSPFNEAKSWLKGLEMASLGVVPVMSPTYDNSRLVDVGAALPASTPKDWYEQVKKLVQDHDYRKEMSEQCRKVASQFTIEDNWNLWWESWEKAFNR